MQFYAHTREDRPPSDWERLEDHLRDVRKLASEFARPIGAEDWAAIAALWHDLGKYSKEFQAYLKHETGFDLHAADFAGRVDHSTAGAQHAVRLLGTPGRILAYCIAGHHAGLADDVAESGSSGLTQRLQKIIPAVDGAPAELLQKPSLVNPPLSLQHGNGNRAAFQLSLFTRMLFSCLVDADFLATEAFVAADRANARPDYNDVFPAMLEMLDTQLNALRPDSETVVSRARNDVLNACRTEAAQNPGLFSLTVPTGGGKTLSSLAFALNHAIQHGKRRIIYAIPFTSIIEQTGNVFRDVFRQLPDEAVLEHHSSTDPDRQTVQSRLAAENWDAPLVVTTNVQLFESLFAARTSRCRKLHRIVGSVIILDEAQCIPVELLEPTLAVIRELVDDYGCTILLCTATQPAIQRTEKFSIGLENVREIVPDPPGLYEVMRRVQVQHLGKLTNTEIAGQLKQHEQFLCIVNTRPHAARLFAELDTTGQAGIFHLSTFMCGQHRVHVLDEIRHRLDAGLPCRVISTQLIEAGVDVDFPVVFRALTGADSIAQAAGRCNREGRLGHGIVYVFDPIDVALRGYLRSVAESTSELFDASSEIDLLDLATMREYFELHYHKHRGGSVRKDDGWDKRRVMECFPPPMGKLKFNFKTAADRFRWIEDSGKTVFVPYGDEGHTLIEQLRDENQPPSRRLLRKLQRYSVRVYDRVFNDMVGSDIELLGNGHAVLLNESCYDNRLGFRSDQTGFHEPDTLII